MKFRATFSDKGVRVLEKGVHIRMCINAKAVFCIHITVAYTLQLSCRH